MMKTRAAALGLLLTLLLTACAARPASPAPPSQENPALPEEETASPLPGLDLSALEAELSQEDSEALAAYLPVLRGEESFRWVAGPYRGYEADWEPRDVTLQDFHDELWEPNADAPGRTDALDLDRLAVQDVTGDGSPELVLLFMDMGYCYLVLHQEDGVVYGTDFSVRWFMDLQQNGMYIGSSGADYQTYYHMSFEDGRFASQELAQAAGGTYAVNGLQVTEEEFAVWEFETMVGGVSWYGPDGALLEDSPG